LRENLQHKRVCQQSRVAIEKPERRRRRRPKQSP